MFEIMKKSLIRMSEIFFIQTCDTIEISQHGNDFIGKKKKRVVLRGRGIYKR